MEVLHFLDLFNHGMPAVSGTAYAHYISPIRLS